MVQTKIEVEEKIEMGERGRGKGKGRGGSGDSSIELKIKGEEKGGRWRGWREGEKGKESFH